MIQMAPSDRAQQAAGILLKLEVAMEEMLAYHKFGRYGGTSCEKPYFLFSHCSHLMFSFWLIDRDSEGRLFAETRRPAVFTTGLEFDPLRYTENCRLTGSNDGIEEHIKNEPKWFTFWMQALERLNPLWAAGFHEFSEKVLQFVAHPDFLQPGTNPPDGQAWEELLRGDLTGRLLLRSLSVLEDLASSIIGYLATLSSEVHVMEQIVGLIGLLSRMRRTILCEVPARGPYVPRTAQSWQPPPALAKLPPAPGGCLTVVPKRDGGGIVCNYTYGSGSEARSHRWIVNASSLPDSYVHELFKTWSQSTGEYLQGPDHAPEAKACWVIQTAEANHLENLSRDVDMLLAAMGQYSICRNLVTTVAGLTRNNTPCWRPGELPWTYVEQLSQAIGKLTSLCREAKQQGADNPAETLIRQVWSVSVPPLGADERREPEPLTTEEMDGLAALPLAAPQPGDSEPAASEVQSYPPDEPQLASEPMLGEAQDPGSAAGSLPDDADAAAERETGEASFESIVAAAQEPGSSEGSPPDARDAAAEQDAAEGAFESMLTERQDVGSSEDSLPDIGDATDEPEAGDTAFESSLAEAPDPGSSAVPLPNDADVADEREAGEASFESMLTERQDVGSSGDSLPDIGDATGEPEAGEASFESMLTERQDAGSSEDSLPDISDAADEREAGEASFESTLTERQDAGSSEDSLPDISDAADERETGDTALELPLAEAPDLGSSAVPLPEAGDPAGEWDTAEAAFAPQAPQAEGSPPLRPTAGPAEPAPGAVADGEQATDHMAARTDKRRRPEVDNALTQRLWAHHHGPDGRARYEPLPQAQLKAELGWNRSRVHRTMASLFGNSPFTTYQAKCADRTILAFLEELIQRASAKAPEACASAPTPDDRSAELPVGPGITATSPDRRPHGARDRRGRRRRAGDRPRGRRSR